MFCLVYVGVCRYRNIGEPPIEEPAAERRLPGGWVGSKGTWVGGWGGGGMHTKPSPWQNSPVWGSLFNESSFSPFAKHDLACMWRTLMCLLRMRVFHDSSPCLLSVSPIIDPRSVPSQPANGKNQRQRWPLAVSQKKKTPGPARELVGLSASSQPAPQPLGFALCLSCL